jgi:hypothetical protein
MKKQFCFILIMMLLAALSSCDQNDPELLKIYKVYNRSISHGKDTGSIHLNDKNSGGGAWVKGKKFTYGTIEFDIKGKNKPDASFVGIAFHGVDDTTFEAIYFRPFNFRSADPDRKAHSVQYIAPPQFGWEVLRNEHPGVYEQTVSPVPDPNAWFHVRITVASKNISVYVNGDQSPSLSVEPLVQTKGEMIGYWVGYGSAGDWKNFKIANANQ